MVESSRENLLSSAGANLRLLFYLRNFTIAGESLAVLVAVGLLDIHLVVGPLVAIIIGLAVLNLVTWFRLRSVRRVTDGEFFLQLSLDVLAFTAVLYFAGGATNPFAWFYLIPVMIAATVLRKMYTWSMALLTVGCYSLLMFFYSPLHMDHSAMSHASGFTLHVFGMWFGFVLSSGLIAFFIVRMAETLRAREKTLAKSREQALRDEQLVALGTLAAGAAHELGTPLGTMAILTDELQSEYGGDQYRSLRDRLQMLSTQIVRCKKAISVVSASAGESQAHSGYSALVDTFVDSLVAGWRSQRPGIDLDLRLLSRPPAPRILVDGTLEQALTNILNNAADASPQGIEMNVDWSGSRVVLNVLDNGPGLSPAVSDVAGKDRVSTKEHGLGLGLYLAHSSINRLGGEVSLFNRDAGGACTRVILPVLGAQVQ